MHPWVRELLDLDLPAGEHALFGSGPLLLRGWIDDVGDLDVIARGRAWARACTLGPIVRLTEPDAEVVEIGDGITIGRAWGIGEFDVDELIDTAEMIEGVPCVQLEHVVAYKRVAARPKDRLHLEIIERMGGP